MDRFHLMQVFVAVADAGSFAGGARQLKMSPPAVTRAVVALEAWLNVRLLTRTTRVVRVTEAGARYLEDARRILLELDEADAAVAGVNATPHGELAVTAPVLFGQQYVMPIIAEYQSAFSQTTVSALFVDRVVNFVDEGLDVGIRIGPLPDSSLRAIAVGRVRRVVVGAPSYLERAGIPRMPVDLAGHQLVASRGVSPGNEWDFVEAGKRLSVRVSPRITVNTNDGALEAVSLGYGLTRLLSYQVAAHIAAGKLQRVLQAYEGPELPVQIIHREGRNGPAKIRSFVDLAVARLRADSRLNPPSS